MPWSRVLLEKLRVTQLVYIFLAFHAIRKLITVLKIPINDNYPEVHISS
jgi:hypothetical protein